MLMLSACLLLASCGENQPSSTDATSPTTPRSSDVASAPRGAQVTAMPVSSVNSPTPGRPAGTESAAPVAPAGAQWTLYCRTIRGPVHVEESSRLKSQLVMNPQLKGWYLVHNDDDSIVCYGYYSSPSDAQAKLDKRRIESLTDVSGQPIFTGVCFQPIASPDPEAPPEWNLSNTPSRMYWSLQIAAFRDNPLRKKAAVEAVRDLRKQGIEAYYFHGPTISSVCVGAWPIQAVKRQGEDNVAHASDPDSSLLVLSEPLPQYARPKERDRDGKPLVTLAPKLEVIDPTLDAAIHKWPEHAVNYEVTEITNPTSGEKFRSPSFLVQIPHPELAGQDPFAGAPDPVGPDDPDAVRSAHSANIGDVLEAGKLRTLGEH
jgi:hypothetical protein